MIYVRIQKLSRASYTNLPGLSGRVDLLIIMTPPSLTTLPPPLGHVRQCERTHNYNNSMGAHVRIMLTERVQELRMAFVIRARYIFATMYLYIQHNMYVIIMLEDTSSHDVEKNVENSHVQWSTHTTDTSDRKCQLAQHPSTVPRRRMIVWRAAVERWQEECPRFSCDSAELESAFVDV